MGFRCGGDRSRFTGGGFHSSGQSKEGGSSLNPLSYTQGAWGSGLLLTPGFQ